MVEVMQPLDSVQPIEADALGPRVADLLEAGGRFVMLVGLDERAVGGDGLAVEVVVHAGDRLERLRAPLPLAAPAYPSISRLVLAAHWDEREAKDLLGIVPIGHPDPRRLVLHERWPAHFLPLRKDVPAGARPPVADRRFVPFEVHGEGVYQLPVGPIHAGVIEPGHFRFSAIGERVLHVDARLFFAHRGLEKLVEGRTWTTALPIVERACGVCTVAHATAYAQAVELLTATDIPPRAAWARVLLGELERLYNHVSDLGGMCAGVAFQSGVARFAWLKERLLRLNEALTGHRYLMGAIAPGGLAADLHADGLAGLPATIAELSDELASMVRAVVRSEGVMDRFHATGVVSETLAAQVGALGVAGRASGLTMDLRRDRPYAAYGEIEIEPVVGHGGDAAARFHVRAREAHESARLVLEARRRLPDGDVAAPMALMPALGASVASGVEGPRGASWIWLRAGSGGTIDRLRLRSASFANWPVVAAAVPGNLVPDFPLINKSFELCYACTDR